MIFFLFICLIVWYFVCLFDIIFVYVFVWYFVCISVHLFVCLCVCLFVWYFICLCVCLLDRVFVYVFVWYFVCLFADILFVYVFESEHYSAVCLEQRNNEIKLILFYSILLDLQVSQRHIQLTNSHHQTTNENIFRDKYLKINWNKTNEVVTTKPNLEIEIVK